MYGVDTLKKFLNVIVDTANLVLMLVKDKKFGWEDVLTCVKELPAIIKQLIDAIKDVKLVDDEWKDATDAEMGELVLHVIARLQVAEGKAKKIVAASLAVMASVHQLVKAILTKEEAAQVVEAPSA